MLLRELVYQLLVGTGQLQYLLIVLVMVSGLGNVQLTSDGDANFRFLQSYKLGFWS
jgi:CDP-diacylglycerol pyrophosphatase